MKSFWLSLSLLLAVVSGNAQISYEKRIEIDLDNLYDNETIYEFGDAGFVLRSASREPSNDENEWKFDLYNPRLEKVRSTSFKLGRKIRALQEYSDENSVYTLFSDYAGNFTLVTVTVEGDRLKVTKATGTLPYGTWMQEMVVMGDYVYVRASIRKAPHLLVTNWKTGKQKAIPVTIEGFKPKAITFDNFQVLKESNEVFLYVRAKVSKTLMERYVIRLNDQGEKEAQFNLSKNITENIISVSACNLQNGEYVFSGTYSTQSRGVSEGFFLGKTKGNNLRYIKFYKYTQFENFLKYLPEATQEKLERKQKRREASGKDFTLNYTLAMHDVVSVEDGFMVLGEAYYPTYRSQTYTTTSYVNGRPVTTTQTRTVFDGYQYTHAVLAKFKEDGTLEWDQIFEMWPSYKPFTPKTFISFVKQDESVFKLAFASRNTIVTTIISTSGDVLKEKKSEQMETEFSGDKVKFSFSTVNYWYDDYFIAHGVQIIKNKENHAVEKKRRVFFVSKIKFE